ncbi:hypothetical protein EG329_008236 [Mollisiaceae sp. DMI_Dod_QoI]|nr:hypothetical protein EG329_008236 [Helotiales sp. DMI_Dod_QoI]
MCGGKADDAPAPAAVPIELPDRRPGDTSARPPTGKSRPKTNHGEERSGTKSRSKTGDRSQSERERRPQSKQRSGSASTRPPRTSEHGGSSRHGSSHKGHQHRERAKHGIPPIQEYTEDKTILKDVGMLGTVIDQHVVNFYRLNNSGSSGDRDMDNPRTRHAAIRRYIAQTIINSMITDRQNETAIAHEMADRLEVYASSNGDRVVHLESLCRLGGTIREEIEEHPSSWEFGLPVEDGYIVLVPALYKDGVQVRPSDRFKD